MKHTKIGGTVTFSPRVSLVYDPRPCTQHKYVKKLC